MTSGAGRDTEYYRNEDIRVRIRDFLGRDSLGKPTCRYLAKGETTEFHLHERLPAGDLNALFEEGTEIARSLWDETALIADLDVEYVNFDQPAEAFLNARRAFDLQRPVEQAIARLLAAYGIRPLHLLSGRGHHFIWQIDRKSTAFLRLANLGNGPASLWQTTAEQRSPEGEVVSPQLARAFAGLGQVMEFLADRVKEIAARDSKIPVELTAVEVGPSDRGREMVSLDISEYGDPLPARMLRVPFSVYLKPWQQRGLIADDLLDGIRPLFVIPLGNLQLGEALPIMRSAEQATRLAATAETGIPDASREMERLIDDYQASSLGKFHGDFYSQEHEPPERWSETYDRVPLETWPACGRFMIEQPNDLLLRPACIRFVVRILLALGWHSRHIAGFIRSKVRTRFRLDPVHGLRSGRARRFLRTRVCRSLRHRVR